MRPRADAGKGNRFFTVLPSHPDLERPRTDIRRPGIAVYVPCPWRQMPRRAGRYRQLVTASRQLRRNPAFWTDQELRRIARSPRPVRPTNCSEPYPRLDCCRESAEAASQTGQPLLAVRRRHISQFGLAISTRPPPTYIDSPRNT